MVRLIGPCMSAEARGKFGNCLIFQVWLGRAYAKRYFKPRNPNTPGQQIPRHRIRRSVDRWKVTDQETRDKWNVVAKEVNRTGYNMYVSGTTTYMRDHAEAEPDEPFEP